jgi:hypothetical protein
VCLALGHLLEHLARRTPIAEAFLTRHPLEQPGQLLPRSWRQLVLVFAGLVLDFTKVATASAPKSLPPPTGDSE